MSSEENTAESNKRRRISTSPERQAPLPEIAASSATAPPELALSSAIAASSNADSAASTIIDSAEEAEEPTTAAPVLFDPDLDEIPKLLLVDLQDEDGAKAGVALKKLCELVAGPEDAKKKKIEETRKMGGHALVIAAMKRHQHNRLVQRSGCRFFQWAVSIAKIPSTLVQLGVFEALANAMTLYPSHENLHFYSCNAIQLLLGSKKSLGKWGPKFVFDLGAIPLILETMQRFLSSPKVVDQCCMCFQRFLLFGADAKKALRSGGVATLVASAVEKYPQDKELQKSASDFMVQFFSAVNSDES